MEPQTTDTRLPTTPRSFPTIPSNTRTPSRSKATWVNTPSTKLHFIVFVQMHLLEETLICKHFLRGWDLALALWTYRAVSVCHSGGKLHKTSHCWTVNQPKLFSLPIVLSAFTHVIMLNISKQLTGRFGVHCAAVNSPWGLGASDQKTLRCKIPFGMFRTTMGRIHNTGAGWAKAVIPHLHSRRSARGLRALWLQRKSACCFHNC